MHMCVALQTPSQTKSYLTASNTSLACVPLLCRNLMPGRPAAWSWRCAGAHVRRVADPVPNRIISDRDQYISGMCPIAKAQLDAWQTCSLVVAVRRCTCASRCRPPSQTESYLTASRISLACLSLLRRNLMPGRPAAWSWRCAGAHVQRVADPVPNRIISDREQYIAGMYPIAKAQLDAWQTCSLVVAVRRCTCASRCRPRPKQNHI